MQESLERKESLGLLRRLKEISHLIDFSSNDYLGLSSKIDSTNVHSVSGRGSRLISGNHKLFEELEQKAAKFFKEESSLFFNSGYDANLGLFSCLLGKDDTYIYDQFSHASIRDGIRLSSANSFSFKHNDLEDLERKIKRAKGNVVVITESVFSMDGDVAPLLEIAEICQSHVVNLVVDEAHGSGIYGDSGEGVVVELGIEQKVLARIHTMGKAAGSQGAFVLGSEVLKTYLINNARSFIYTTALPLQHISEVSQSVDLIQHAAQERETLQKNIEYFKNCIKSFGLESFFEPRSGAIQILKIEGNDNAKILSSYLEIEGFYVKAILSPTVPQGKERLRFCVNANHQFNMIERLFETLEKKLK